MNALIAYVLAFFVVGALGGIVVTLLTLPLVLMVAKFGSRFVTVFVSFANGVFVGWLAFYLGIKLFQWLGVEFGILAVLTIFVPILSNDLKRAQSGLLHEVTILVGTACSFLYFTFLVLSR